LRENSRDRKLTRSGESSISLYEVHVEVAAPDVGNEDDRGLRAEM
jgi:hypothetical protein